MTCKVDGCEKPAHGRGWCKAHHTRWLRHGDPLTVRANGAGGRAAARAAQSAAVLAALPPAPRRAPGAAQSRTPMTIEQQEWILRAVAAGVTRAEAARQIGCAATQAERIVNRGKARAGSGPRRIARVCAVDGCGDPYFARGWCKRHYHQQYRGRPLSPPPARVRKPAPPAPVRQPPPAAPLSTGDVPLEVLLARQADRIRGAGVGHTGKRFVKS